MRFLSLIFLMFFAACAPQSGVISDGATGLTGQFTRQVVISDHPHHVLMGHLIQTTRDGVQTRALVIGQRRDGVHRVRMVEAWSDGIELPFSATTRRLDGCTHGHCRDNAVGVIFLSDQLLADGRSNGLSARLIGRSAAINIEVPATLFQALQE